MRNLLDIIHLLKRYGVFIYTGNRADDIDLMMSEVKDLYEYSLITKEDYVKAIMILRQELTKIKK